MVLLRPVSVSASENRQSMFSKSRIHAIMEVVKCILGFFWHVKDCHLPAGFKSSDVRVSLKAPTEFFKQFVPALSCNNDITHSKSTNCSLDESS